jgi:hypothetical protein
MVVCDCMQAVVLLTLGQASNSQEQLKAAQQYFQVRDEAGGPSHPLKGRSSHASGM